MKCYFGGSVDPFEYDFVAACFANNSREAKKLMWDKSDKLAEECDGEWISARVIRKPCYDDLINQEKKEPYIIRDDKTLRLMGWMQEGDSCCDSCALYEFSGDYPICEECGQCEECGHDTDCTNQNNQ